MTLESIQVKSANFLKNKFSFNIFFKLTVPTTTEQTDDRIQRRSTVRLGIRLLHKICPETNLSNNESQPTVPRSLRLRLSPKARKLIKQTSLIIHGSNSSTNNTNGTVNSITTEADITDGTTNKVSNSLNHFYIRFPAKTKRFRHVERQIIIE